MKKHLSLILGVTMLLSTCTTSFAAVNKLGSYIYGNHEYGNMDTLTDTWYTIETKKPYLMGSVIYADPQLNANFELYCNEQTFFDLLYKTEDKTDEIIFNGSYLFDSGLFVGGYIDYVKNRDLEQGANMWRLWPGYRFNFDQGYASASVTIGKTINDKVEVLNIDFDGQYLFDNAKIEGELIIPNGGDSYLALQGRLKLIEEFTAGLDLTIIGDHSSIMIGATYIPVPELIIDAQISDNYSTLSGMYYLDNFGMGMQYIKIIDVSQIYLKGKYNIIDEGSLVLKYGLKNDNVPSIIILGYEHAF